MSEQPLQKFRIALYPDEYLTLRPGELDGTGGNVSFDFLKSFPETSSDIEVGTITVAVDAEHDPVGMIKRAAEQLREGLVGSLDFIIEELSAPDGPG